MSGRFVKGQSGNPSGRPKARRPNVSAFDIIFDKMLTATHNGVERELTIDEALHLQTYQAALKGNKMAVRTVLKMIEKREVALKKLAPPVVAPPKPRRIEYNTDNADEAIKLLNIIGPNPGWEDGPRPFVVETWAAQAAISRPGRALRGRDSDFELFVRNYDTLKWPRGRQR